MFQHLNVPTLYLVQIPGSTQLCFSFLITLGRRGNTIIDTPLDVHIVNRMLYWDLFWCTQSFASLMLDTIIPSLMLQTLLYASLMLWTHSYRQPYAIQTHSLSSLLLDSCRLYSVPPTATVNQLPCTVQQSRLQHMYDVQTRQGGIWILPSIPLDRHKIDTRSPCVAVVTRQAGMSPGRL